MILDDKLKLSAAQAFVAGTAVSTLSHDLGPNTPVRDLSAGKEMCFVFMPTVAGAGSTDTTSVKIVTSATSNLASNTDLISRTIPNAQLTVGKPVILDMPFNAVYQRYIGAEVTLGTGDTVTMNIWGPVPRKDVAQPDRYHDSGFVVA